jgi:hypothetical protein
MTVTDTKYVISITETDNIITVVNTPSEIIEMSPVIIEVTNAANITKSLQCGEIIGGGKMVYINSGKIYIASNDNTSCKGKVIGMTQQSGILDAFVNVVLSGECNGLSLIENEMYYLGLNGVITKTIPLVGFVQPVGVGIASDRININLENYIIRG